MKKLLLLLSFIALPCYAGSVYEVYYPNTMKVINTNFMNPSYYSPTTISVEGVDKGSRVLYLSVFPKKFVKRFDLNRVKFILVPSKNVHDTIKLQKIE